MLILSICGVLGACGAEINEKKALVAAGTWRLVSGLSIQEGDTTFTDYTTGPEGIKIITKTHFAFLIHDLNKGQDSTATFVSGGGRASVDGLKYTEYLDYCNYRELEGEKFEFDLLLKPDTLVQSGIEKVEATGTERKIIETYVRVD